MATLGQVMVEVGADLKDFQQKMKQAERTMADVGKGIEGISDDMVTSFEGDMLRTQASLLAAQRRMKELEGQMKRTYVSSSKNMANLPEHLRPFAETIYDTRKNFQQLERDGVGSLEELSDAVLKTKVGLKDMTSVSDSGKDAIKLIQNMESETKKARLAVLGFNEDATMKIDTKESSKRLLEFQSYVKHTQAELEKLKAAGDFGSYTEGMRQLESQMQKVDKAMRAAAYGGTAYIGELERMGVVTESVGNAAALAMEEMRESFMHGNDVFQAQATQSEKIIKNLARMDVRGLDQQFLKLGVRLEKMAKQGTAANVAIQELGKNASMKDILDQTRLINQGLMRMQSLQMGMGIGVGLYTVGMVKLSNALDGRLIPAFDRFKSVWADALEPMVKAWTTMAKAVLDFGTKVGEAFNKFTEAHPIIAGMIGNIMYLASVFTLLLSPLAIGISRLGSMRAAFTALWAIIGPFVTGFLAVIGTALAVAAALVGVTVAIQQMWKHSEEFRTAFIDLWNGIKEAFVEAFAPVLAKVDEFKQALATLWEDMTGKKATFEEIWQAIGDKVAEVVDFIAPYLTEVLAMAFDTAAAIIIPILDLLIEGVKKFGDWWKENGPAIEESVGKIVGKIMEGFGEVASFLQEKMPQIQDIVTKAFELMGQLIDLALNATIIPTIIAAFNWIKSNFDWLFPILVSIVSDAWETIKSAISNALNLIEGMIDLFSGIIEGDWNKVWESLKKIVESAAGLIWDYVNLWFGSKIIKVFKKFGEDAVKKISDSFEKMKSNISKKVSDIKSDISTKFTEAKNKITKPIEEAKSTVLGIIDEIKGAFEKMSIKIPKPKIPKIEVSSKTVFGGKGGIPAIEIPTFSVSWNAKGNIFNGASILGGGQGVGEAGAEVVMPIQRKRYMKPYASMVASLLDDFTSDKGNGGNVVNNFNIASLVVREEADIEKISAALEKKQRQQKRAKGGFVFA